MQDKPQTTESTPHANPPAKAPGISSFFKGLAIVGIVALLAFGTWGTIQMIRNSPTLVGAIGAAVANFTSTFFPAGTPSLRIAVGTYRLDHQTPFTLSWTTENMPTDARYVFVYECADRLSFTAESTSISSATIDCGELYIFDASDNSLIVTPLSPDNRFLDAAIKVGIVTENQILAEDEVLLTIENDRVRTTVKNNDDVIAGIPEAPETTGGSAQTSYYPVYNTVTVPRPSDPNGYVDLSIEIIKTGVLDGNSNRFSSTGPTLDRSERGGITFAVRNLGTKTSEKWELEAKLPTRSTYTFRRANQPALAPGDRIEYTMGFDRITSRDEGKIEIKVDPKNNLKESNRANNSTSITVEIEK